MSDTYQLRCFVKDLACDRKIFEQLKLDIVETELNIIITEILYLSQLHVLKKRETLDGLAIYINKLVFEGGDLKWMIRSKLG